MQQMGRADWVVEGMPTLPLRHIHFQDQEGILNIVQ